MDLAHTKTLLYSHWTSIELRTDFLHVAQAGVEISDTPVDNGPASSRRDLFIRRNDLELNTINNEKLEFHFFYSNSPG